MFSFSDLKQTKLYQEAIKESREEGQQRGKIPAQLDYITLATALDLDMERGREVPENCRQNLSVIGQFYETNSLRPDDSFYLWFCYSFIGSDWFRCHTFNY